MSYFCSDANAFLGHLANGPDLHLLASWAEREGSPAVRRFFEKGCTKAPLALAQEVETAESEDAATRTLLRRLANLARRADATAR